MAYQTVKEERSQVKEREIAKHQQLKTSSRTVLTSQSRQDSKMKKQRYMTTNFDTEREIGIRANQYETNHEKNSY